MEKDPRLVQESVRIFDNLLAQMHGSGDNPWIFLSPDIWEDLTDGMQPILYPGGSCIYNQGNFLSSVYIVKSGRVRMSYYTSDGEERGIFIAEKNCMFGEAAALPHFTTYYTATAITNSEIYEVSRNILIDRLYRCPELAFKLLLLQMRKMRTYSRQEVEITFSEAYSRICHYLQYLCECYGEEASDSAEIRCVKINVRFTQQELADMVHVSRVTVSNIIKNLIERGKIKKESGFYYVKNPDMLDHQ